MAEPIQNQSVPIIRDPALVRNRVFVGNLPQCVKEELESIFRPYGKVLGSLVHKNFGFVQFESEEIANKAACALSKSTFKGNVITVRNAGSKQHQAAKHAANVIPATAPELNPDYNDCEIIVVDRKNTTYAEHVEERLKKLNMRVDVLFPNEDVPLGKVLGNITSRGCLYAIVVTNQHQENQSLTVNVLYDQPVEHRNMPVDDAITLIANDYRKKRARESTQNVLKPNVGRLPNPVPIIPAASLVAPPLKEQHPQPIQVMLNLLANNHPLTVLQYDRIIKYLTERRDFQIKVELGDAAEPTNRAPDPEIALQKKIISILNKPSVAETHYELLYPTLEAVKQDFGLMELLKDVRVQKAIDTLMDSNLVGTIERAMKF